jgi:glycosyltransferase involved in cell wall biosynthesis
MKMRVIAIVMVYNCGDIIEGALKDLDGKVDEIQCFDGKWSFRIKESDFSTDNTKEVIENFAKTSKSKIEYHQLQPNLGEKDSRNISLQCAQDGDWILIFDSDERIISWNDNLHSELERSKEWGYIVLLDGSICPFCKLYKKMQGVKYYMRDCRVGGPDGHYDLEYMTKRFKYIGINLAHKFSYRMRRAGDYPKGPHP